MTGGVIKVGVFPGDGEKDGSTKPCHMRSLTSFWVINRPCQPVICTQQKMTECIDGNYYHRITIKVPLQQGLKNIEANALSHLPIDSETITQKHYPTMQDFVHPLCYEVIAEQQQHNAYLIEEH